MLAYFLAACQRDTTGRSYGNAESYRDIEGYGHKRSLDAALTDVAANNATPIPNMKP